jgi:hypothetical protein
MSPSRFQMDTFFDKKQIYVGAVLLGIFELSVVLVRAFAH